MKKLYALILALCMLASLAACGASRTEAPAATAEPAATEEPAAEAMEAPAETEAPAEITGEDADWAAALEVIQTWGNAQNGCSELSFTLDSSTLADCGDYWTVTAEFSHGLEIPEGLQEGDTFTVTTDELRGGTETFTAGPDRTYTDSEGYDGYYGFTGSPYMFCDSDDRVDVPFYTGTLRILKTAQTGVAIIQEYHTLTEEDLADDPWFNGVTFDGAGYVTSLVFYGD